MSRSRETLGEFSANLTPGWALSVSSMEHPGWRDRILERSWPAVRDFESAAFESAPSGQYLFDIIDSVVVSGVADQLAVTTSMHDLVIAGRPVAEPPLDVLVVRAPGSLSPPSAGSVLIEYLAVSGRNTAIQRPEREAVPLFWRFVEEKFGIVAVRGR